MKSYQHIALQRIHILFNEAAKAYAAHPQRSHRYVTLARTIAMKSKVKIPPALKRLYCHYCYAFLRPGSNARVRTRERTLITTCSSCKHHMRMPLLKKPKQAPSSRTSARG